MSVPAYLGEQLSSPPLDGISQLRYSTESDLLIASSWDKVGGDLQGFDLHLNPRRSTKKQAGVLLLPFYSLEQCDLCRR